MAGPPPCATGDSLRTCRWCRLYGTITARYAPVGAYLLAVENHLVNGMIVVRMRPDRSSPTLRGRLAVLGGVVIALTACNMATAIRPPVDRDAAGSWAEDFGGLAPGTSFLLTMTEASGVVTGTGTATGEAIAPASVTVVGGVAHRALDLQIVFIADPAFAPNARPDTTHFVGVLSTRDRIDGTLKRSSGTTSALRLIRRATGSPQ
jgi:hypothetical protein